MMLEPFAAILDYVKEGVERLYPRCRPLLNSLYTSYWPAVHQQHVLRAVAYSENSFA